MKLIHKTQADYTLYDVLTNQYLVANIMYFIFMLIVIMTALFEELGFLPRPEVTEKDIPWVLAFYGIAFIVLIGKLLPEDKLCNS